MRSFWGRPAGAQPAADRGECRSGALAKRIGPISDDTIGYALQRQSPEPVFALGCEVARRLKRNGVLRSDWSRGLVVAAVDGIEICSSFARCCDACMQREVQHKVRGQLRTDVQYYHRIVAVVVVSTPVPIPLGLRFQKKRRGRSALRAALLQDLVDRLGRRFLDLLVGDALYLQAPFVKEVERLGLDWAFTLKENQPDLLREAERFTAGPPAGVEPETDRELRWWHVPQIDWPAGDRLIRVIKTVRTGTQTSGRGQTGRRSSTEKQERSGRGEHQLLRTNFELGAIPRGSSINSAAAGGASTPRSFRPSHQLPPQTSGGPSKHGPGGADHDPAAGLYAVVGLLPPTGPQPCPGPLLHLPRIRQAPGLLVRRSRAQHKLTRPP